MADALLQGFTVNRITDQESSFDTRLNVHKRKERVLYRNLSDIDNANLAYTISNVVSSDKNLTISAHEDALSENRILEESQVRLFSGSSITVLSDKVLITNQFITETNTQIDVPLFRMHVLKDFDSDDDQILDISITVDLSAEALDTSEVIFDKEDGRVFNNLSNSYDYNTGETVLYYIRYTVKDIDSEVVRTVNELLDNENIFHAATFDDVDTFGYLYTDRLVYLIEEITPGLFELTLPIATRYALIDNNQSRIALLHPPIASTRNPWHARVRTGHFFASVEVEPDDFNLIRYNIPEFTNQIFDPIYPYKFVEDENSIRVNNRIIKVLKDNITEDDDKPIQVILRYPDNTVRAVLSTDEDVIGTTVEDVIVLDRIRSFDQANGFIDLSMYIEEDDIIEVSYYFEETNYEVIDIDFNPLNNREIIKQRAIFYIVPNTSNSRSKTIFYLIVDQLGRIISTNQSDNGTLLSNIDTGLFYNIDSTTDFINKYTVESTNTPSIYNPQYLVLGEVSVDSNSHPSQTELLDIRRPGGGIKNTEGLLEELVQTVAPEAIWLNNTTFWDGIPYPGSAAFAIEVPVEIQSVNDGKFSDINIRGVVERHTALGIYPIIRGYNNADVILDVDPSTTSIDLTWRSFGGNKTYNIYYSTEENGNYIKANPLPIGDVSDGNTYTLSDLDENAIYWIYCVLVRNDIELSNAIIGKGIEAITNRVYNKISTSTYSITP